MASYEAEQARLLRLMEEELSDTEMDYDDELESDEEDFVEERESGSETEQEVSDNERRVICEEMELEDSDSEVAGNILTFVGRNKKTHWSKEVPKKSIRIRAENKVIRLPISKLATRSLKSAMDIFKYFIDNEMLNLIVQHTNAYINLVAENYTRERDASPTNIAEVQALLGLLFYAGVLKANHLNAEELWKSDGTGIEIFRLTMSIKRFKFLMRCIRFDDKSTRQERKNIDKLAPIRDFFDNFVNKCKNGFSLSEYVTIDEKLEAFRGRCSFRQYIPSKPNKYGIKIFALSDSRMYYTSNLEVYVGKQPEGPYKVSNSPFDIVLRLCDAIKDSGRNLTIDNWFTSIPLVEKLLKDYKLTVIGTLRKNKPELPLEFSNPAHPPGASMFGFTKDLTLVSYIPKKKKNVLLLSSLHHDDNIDRDSGKPEIIIDYNKTKGGVDTVDRLCANYNVARNTRRWPMVVFFSILNVAGINTFVVHNSNNPTSDMNRRKFLRILSYDLVQPHLRLRAEMENIPRTLKSRLREICHIPDIPDENQRRGETGRCSECSSKRNRKTRYRCRDCSKFLCLEHVVVLCKYCHRLTH